MSAPAPSLMCSNPDCPGVGMWVDVDLAALAFAHSEGIPVLCERCHRALVHIPRRRPAGRLDTTHEYRQRKD